MDDVDKVTGTDSIWEWDEDAPPHARTNPCRGNGPHIAEEDASRADLAIAGAPCHHGTAPTPNQMLAADMRYSRDCWRPGSLWAAGWTCPGAGLERPDRRWDGKPMPAIMAEDLGHVALTPTIRRQSARPSSGLKLLDEAPGGMGA